MNFDNVFKAMHKKALAGYSMPKGIGDALKPAPAAMKIDAPKQAEGNAQMAQAAAAEGVGVNAGTPSDPVSALTASLDKITAVAKGSLPKAQATVNPTAAPAEPNPAQVAQQQNQTAPQPGVPKMASSISAGKLLLYKLIKG